MGGPSKITAYVDTTLLRTHEPAPAIWGAGDDMSCHHLAKESAYLDDL